MKKIILCAFTSLLACAFIPNESKAAATLPGTIMPADSAGTKILLENRLKEIRQADKSAMSREDKKASRHEERAIEKALHDGYGGIYISVGALIIIILILIILL